jgi:hypothetical protein
MILFPAAALGLAVAGGGVVPPRGDSSGAIPSPEPHSFRDRDTRAVAPDDTLRLHLQIGDSIPRGRTVPVVLRIENVSGRALDLYLRGREPTFDLLVFREGEPDPVWRLLEGEVIPAILRVDSLEPGRHWNSGPGGPGRIGQAHRFPREPMNSGLNSLPRGRRWWSGAAW